MSQFNYGSLLWEIDRKFKTRKEFCDKIGISEPTFYRYMNGASSMPSSFILKTCVELSIPREEIGVYFFAPIVDGSKQ